MQELYKLLIRAHFQNLPIGWGDTWSRDFAGTKYEVSIRHPDWRSKKPTVDIEREIGRDLESWNDLTLKDARAKLRQLLDA